MNIRNQLDFEKETFMVEKSQKIAEMRPGHTFFVCDSDYSSACAATVKRALHENLYPFYTHYTGANIHTPAQERCCNFFAVNEICCAIWTSLEYPLQEGTEIVITEIVSFANR